MRTWIPTTCLLLALLATAAFSARAAHADDHDVRGKPRPVKNAVAKLTKDELKLLKSKIKGWDELDAGKRQALARGMLRIRGMTDDERKRLGDHIRGRGKRGHFRDHAGAALMNRGLATAVRAELGQDFERRLRQQDISEHGLERAVAMSFWRKVAERSAKEGDPVKPDALPDGFPARWRAHYDRGYRQWASTNDAKRKPGQARRLHHKLAMFRGEELRARLRTRNLRGDAYIAAVAAEVRKAWPEAFAEVVKDPDTLMRSADRAELKRGIHRLVKRTSRLEKEESVLLVTLLNRLARHHRAKTVTGTPDPDDVIKFVLVREFKLSAEVVATLPPADQPEARAAFLARHLGRFAYGMRGDKHRAGGSGIPKSGTQKSGTQKFKRPEGLSDADWKIWTAAVSDLRQRRDFRAIPGLLKTKPEGMSDEGHTLIRKAFLSRMGNRGGRGRDGRKGGPKAAGGKRERRERK